MGLQVYGLLLSERPAVRIRLRTPFQKKRRSFFHVKDDLRFFLFHAELPESIKGGFTNEKSSDRHDGRYPLPCFPPGRLPALLLLEESKEGLRSRQRELLLSNRAAQRPQQVRRVPLQAGKALCAGSLLQRPDGTAGETR